MKNKVNLDDIYEPYKGLLLYCLYVAVIIGGFTMWTDRNLDFWMSCWQKKEIDVPYWTSLIITIVFNGIIIAVNIIAEIIRFYIKQS